MRRRASVTSTAQVKLSNTRSRYQAISMTMIAFAMTGTEARRRPLASSEWIRRKCCHYDENSWGIIQFQIRPQIHQLKYNTHIYIIYMLKEIKNHLSSRHTVRISNRISVHVEREIDLIRKNLVIIQYFKQYRRMSSKGKKAEYSTGTQYKMPRERVTSSPYLCKPVA